MHRLEIRQKLDSSSDKDLQTIVSDLAPKVTARNNSCGRALYGMLGLTLSTPFVLRFLEKTNLNYTYDISDVVTVIAAGALGLVSWILYNNSGSRAEDSSIYYTALTIQRARENAKQNNQDKNYNNPYFDYQTS